MNFLVLLIIVAIGVGIFFVVKRKKADEILQKIEDKKDLVTDFIKDKVDHFVEKNTISVPPNTSYNPTPPQIPSETHFLEVPQMPAATTVPAVSAFSWHKVRFFGPLTPDEALFNFIADKISPDVAFAWVAQSSGKAVLSNTLRVVVDNSVGAAISGPLIGLYQPGGMEKNSQQWKMLGMEAYPNWYTPVMGTDFTLSNDGLTLTYKGQGFKLPSPARKPSTFWWVK